MLRHALERWVDPAAVFASLYSNAPNAVWLDSGADAREGRSYLGAGTRVIGSDAGSVLGQLSRELRADALDAETDGFALGWVGWIDYETRFDTMGDAEVAGSRRSASSFVLLDRAVEFDHARGVATLIALGDDWSGELDQWRRETVRAITNAAGVDQIPDAPATAPPAWRDSDDRYLHLIAECQRAIAAGNAYQLCLTTEVSVQTSVDPLATYLRLRASSPSHHGGLIRIGDVTLLSASPEQFLSVTPAGVIHSKPIKGTRPRGATATEDAALAASLESSEKERAENLMIVDLMRNDLSRVSRIGSVEVTSLLAVESYAHVHQLVSTVRGELLPGLSGVDAVAACFPAGSMTGTPKSSAVRILSELEGAPRGIYSGVFGYFGLDGRIDLAMVIRSIVMTSGLATVGTGGGITILSEPVEELAEVKLKAAALLRALGAG
jgi:anthranilate synthase component 1